MQETARTTVADAVTGRVRIEETTDGVRVRMPGPRSPWALPGLVLLMPIAAYLTLGDLVALDVARRTARTTPLAPAVAIVAVLALIALATNLPVVAAAVALLYHAAGREVVTATPWMLSDTRVLLGLSRRRSWPASRVSGLRLSPMAGGDADPRTTLRRGILFEVDGTRTRTFAEGCTPAEAAEVLDAVASALARPTLTREVTA